MQLLLSLPFPLQEAPPYCGAGFEHALSLVFVPDLVPAVQEHPDHAPQSPQPPSIGSGTLSSRAFAGSSVNGFEFTNAGRCPSLIILFWLVESAMSGVAGSAVIESQMPSPTGGAG